MSESCGADRRLDPVPNDGAIVRPVCGAGATSLNGDHGREVAVDEPAAEASSDRRPPILSRLRENGLPDAIDVPHYAVADVRRADQSAKQRDDVPRRAPISCDLNFAESFSNYRTSEQRRRLDANSNIDSVWGARKATHGASAQPADKRRRGFKPD